MMGEYSSENLKSLGDFVKETALNAIKETRPNDKNYTLLMEFYGQLEAIRFNPLLFKSILSNYDVDFSSMVEPLKKVALHINDSGIISKTIVQWRCTNGV